MASTSGTCVLLLGIHSIAGGEGTMAATWPAEFCFLFLTYNGKWFRYNNAGALITAAAALTSEHTEHTHTQTKYIYIT